MPCAIQAPRGREQVAPRWVLSPECRSHLRKRNGIVGRERLHRCPILPLQCPKLLYRRYWEQVLLERPCPFWKCAPWVFRIDLHIPHIRIAAMHDPPALHFDSHPTVSRRVSKEWHQHQRRRFYSLHFGARQPEPYLSPKLIWHPPWPVCPMYSVVAKPVQQPSLSPLSRSLIFRCKHMHPGLREIWQTPAMIQMKMG